MIDQHMRWLLNVQDEKDEIWPSPITKIPIPSEYESQETTQGRHL